MELTYKAYAEMIQALRENEFAICDYYTHGANDKCAILRHDVDSCLNRAVVMAEFEEKLDLQSTYFLLLSTDMYNIASKESLSKIERIKMAKHNIGLHFDETKYIDTDNNDNWLRITTEAIIKEIKLMEEITGLTIDTVSMHRPSKRILDADLQLDKIINSYGKLFFRDYKYVSDSRAHWREDVMGIIHSGKFRKLHILTHPFWYQQEQLSATQIVDRYIEEAAEDRYQLMYDNAGIREDICSWVSKNASQDK